MARATKRTPGKQPELDKDTEARLLDAAGRVFAEKGLDGGSGRHLGRAAGVRSGGGVNYYCRSKENLYEATLRHAFRCRLAHAPAPEWPAGTPPAVKLRQFVRMAVKTMLDDFAEPWQMRLLMRELSHPG